MHVVTQIDHRLGKDEEYSQYRSKDVVVEEVDDKEEEIVRSVRWILAIVKLLKRSWLEFIDFHSLSVETLVVLFLKNIVQHKFIV